MKTLRSLLVYLVALAFIPLVVVAFANLYPIARGLMGASGLTIAPHITGGPVATRVEHGAYVTSIHRPVFESLLGRPREGFVQVTWSRKADVPAVIDEEIDYDADGTADFRIRWDRAAGDIRLTPHRPEVGTLAGHYVLAERYAVRVNLTASK
jgi:hypothetical protein